MLPDSLDLGREVAITERASLYYYDYQHLSKNGPGQELSHLIHRATLGGIILISCVRRPSVQRWSNLFKVTLVEPGRARIQFEIPLLQCLCSYHYSISYCLLETSVLFSKRCLGSLTSLSPHPQNVPSNKDLCLPRQFFFKLKAVLILEVRKDLSLTWNGQRNWFL